MRVVDLIQKKKEGKVHTQEEINFLVENYTKGLIEDYQMSAWLMAVCFKGQQLDQELSSTTEARTQWNDIFKVKKENNYPIRKQKEIFQAKIK